ncbi:MAG: DEAD/DEAH box helicase [Clostridia bacterium]|nr:DEAD/DEAH box helicase [Clostridia bacterium]
MDIFGKFPPFLQDYIYSHGWSELRDVQVRAAEVLFETENNLLITSPTASGKTEAALFPVLSKLYEEEPNSIDALYIAPLKSLINDQFSRLDEVLDMSGIPVFHWHGDVAMSHKSKALKDPRGILQITPESLESMLMNRSNDIVRLFGSLRYVILDEVHTLTGSDRGNQILCQLTRIARTIGYDPVRIGLSATVGDIDAACKWLGAGSVRETVCVDCPDTRTSWRLGMEHFYIQNEGDGEGTMPSEDKYIPIDPGFEYIYDCSREKKCLIFSNSREETEYLTATLRQIADRRGEEDVFQIHHGNLSASIREEAELKLKDEDIRTVTCATVTLELGIDIGRLERIIQLESPHSVSSLLQRLGRSGRRGNPPEMMTVFREENPLPNTPLPSLMPWELIRAIAIVQLYLEERFIEPPSVRHLPFSLLFQQTLSVLAASGELSAKALAERVLTLPPFSHVSAEDYRTLLVSMLNLEYLEMTEEKTLIIGVRGERLINSFKFYAVFKDSEDFTVRCGSDEIGTITTPPPVGDRFALAGRVWEVEELDIPRKLIYCKQVKGKMEVSWPGDYGEIHTKILKRMKKVLEEDTVYPYLKENARKRLSVARGVARNTGMLEKGIVHLGGYTWCLFPWLGTRSFRTLRKFIAKNGASFGLSGLEFEGCFYMTFKLEKGDGESFMKYIKRVAKNGIDKSSLVSPNECPVFEKYDDRIPSELLRKAYVADRLRTDEIMELFGTE